MLPIRAAFASFSTNDLAAAKAFYGGKLGLEIRDHDEMGFEVMLGKDQHVTIYPKPNHEPATYTVLNFVVADIEAGVDALTAMGVQMEHYDMPNMAQDAKGILRDPDGAAIAWFKDPAGNTLAIVEDPTEPTTFSS